MKTKKLALVKVITETFDTTPCTFWKDRSEEIYMTREEIGRALGYRHPEQAIAKIHGRHADRLDPLSVVVEMVSADGKTYPRYLYNRKGIIEICRWSRKPLADEFMDFSSDIVEQYYKHNLVPLEKVLELAVQLAQSIMQTMQIGIGANLETGMNEMKLLMSGIVELLHAHNHLQSMDDMIRNGISNNRIRAGLTGMIKAWCQEWKKDERECWNWIYGEFQDRFGFNVWKEASKLKITPINWFDSAGYLPVLALLALAILFGQRIEE